MKRRSTGRKDKDTPVFSVTLALLALLQISVWSIGVLVELEARDFYARATSNFKEIRPNSLREDLVIQEVCLAQDLELYRKAAEQEQERLALLQYHLPVREDLQVTEHQIFVFLPESSTQTSEETPAALVQAH